MNDGLMPIEDSMLPSEYGTPKETRYVSDSNCMVIMVLIVIDIRFFENALHMGYPAANGAVYPWMESVMD